MTDQAGMAVTVNSVESAWTIPPFTLDNLMDVAATEDASIDGHVLAWNQGEGEVDAGRPCGERSEQHDGRQYPAESVGIDNFALVWQNARQRLGAGADCDGGFSGAYGDLVGKPALATVATSGAYPTSAANLRSPAVANSGNYSDLSGLPVIPVTLTMLNDVRVTEGAGINGKALVWNQADTQWEPGTVASSVSTLSDVQLSSPSNGQALVWNATASKWENGAVSGGGSAVAVQNGGTAVTASATTLNFVNATSITNANGAVTITLPTGGGARRAPRRLRGDSDVAITSPSDGQSLVYHSASSNGSTARGAGAGAGATTVYGAAGFVYKPPLAASFTGHNIQKHATFADISAPGMPSLAITVPTLGSNNLECLMNVAPATPYSLTIKVRQTQLGSVWAGCGAALFNSGTGRYVLAPDGRRRPAISMSWR